MKYLELIKESNEELQERYELVAERVAEIAKDASEAGKYADYFEKTAQITAFWGCPDFPDSRAKCYPL